MKVQGGNEVSSHTGPGSCSTELTQKEGGRGKLMVSHTKGRPPIWLPEGS